MKSSVYLLLLTAVATLFGQAPAAAPNIRMLVVTGNQVSHDWRATTAEIRKLIEDTGKFDVRVTEEFRGATADTLKPYDVVLLNYAARKPDNRWPEATESALMEWVRSGKGIVVYHFTLSALMMKKVTSSLAPAWAVHSKIAICKLAIISRAG